MGRQEQVSTLSARVRGETTRRLAAAFLGLAACRAAPGAAWTWQIQTVAQNAGPSCSLRIGPGDIPLIAWSDTGGNVNYASWDPGGWGNEVVASGGAYPCPSLAIGGSGQPAIAFRDPGGNLKYAGRHGSDWEIETVDTGVTPYYSYSPFSLQADQTDVPRIAYFKEGWLRYAVRDGRVWEIEALALALYGSPQCSLALDQLGRAGIAYAGESNWLCYAAERDSAWRFQWIEKPQQGVSNFSLAFDSLNQPRIAYGDGGGQVLKYSAWDGSTWKTVIIDFYNNPRCCSIALDTTDAPWVAWLDQPYPGGAPPYSLYVSAWLDFPWLVSLVDTATTSIGAGSLALDSHDKPWVCYVASGALKLAHLALVGDADWDHDVDFSDYQALEGNFGATSDATWQQGDFDQDGDVDFADYQALEANYGSAATPAPPGVPEPTGLALLALGGIGGLLRRR